MPCRCQERRRELKKARQALAKGDVREAGQKVASVAVSAGQDMSRLARRLAEIRARRR